MPPRKIVALQDDESWNRYLMAVFEDTSSKPLFARSAEESLLLIRQGSPEVVFASPHFLTRPVTAALKVNRAVHAHFRAFSLGDGRASGYPFDGTFEALPPSLHDFQKRLVERIPLPDPLRILLVDDDPEIGELFRDYFDRRTHPSILVEVVQDVKEAEEQGRQFSPHVFVLDLRWPEGEGRELYRTLCSRTNPAPILVLTSLLSPEEITELRQLGHPAIVDKGSTAASMPALSALIKKLAYFG